MVKNSLVQCTVCKTIFNSRFWLVDMGGIWITERYYEEVPIEKQSCPGCGSSNLNILGKIKISREKRRKLTIK